MQNPIIPNRFILVFLHWSTQKIDPGFLYGLNHFTTITRCELQLIKIISTDLQVLYRKILCKDPRPFFFVNLHTYPKVSPHFAFPP